MLVVARSQKFLQAKFGGVEDDVHEDDDEEDEEEQESILSGKKKELLIMLIQRWWFEYYLRCVLSCSTPLLNIFPAIFSIYIFGGNRLLPLWKLLCSQTIFLMQSYLYNQGCLCSFPNLFVSDECTIKWWWGTFERGGRGIEITEAKSKILVKWKFWPWW